MAWFTGWLDAMFNPSHYWRVLMDQLLIFLVVVLAIVLAGRFITRFVFNRLQKWLGNTTADWMASLLQAYERPLLAFWVVLGLYLGLKWFSISAWEVWLDKLFRSAIIVLAAWGLYRFSGTTTSWMVRLGQRFDVHVDRMFIPILSRSLRIVIVVLTFTILAQEWGYRIEGLIAGLGLGGLAVSLAAKDMLANFFGGLAIITEKHFTIGDWIQTPTVEGTVEGITFRSTLVRTFDQALVMVPNSILANEAIRNWSKMGKRRVMYHLSLSYNTPREKLQRTVERIREMLRNHPDVHPETIWVYFEQFGQSSFDVKVYFFTKATAAGEYYRVREACNFKILEILEEEGVQLDFPSRTLYVEQMSGAHPALLRMAEAEKWVAQDKDPERKNRPFPAD